MRFSCPINLYINVFLSSKPSEGLTGRKPIQSTFQFVFDLNLEFLQNKAYLTANSIIPQADILLLAGDIVPFAFRKDHDNFFRFVSKNFKYTYWLPGNHEYYGADAAVKSGSFKEKIKNNVFLVNNIAVTHSDVRFLFSTLWSKINPSNDWMIEKSVSDFSAIRYKGYRFSTPVFNELHQSCMNFLAEELQKEESGKTVVVTHHVPTLLNYPLKYKGSIINKAFTVELYGFIKDSNADAWIYGHHHVNIPEFRVGNTRLLTNQLGYVQQSEHLLFDRSKTIRI